MSEPEIGFRAPLPEELAPLFPKYQILSLIATGGMGAVYHAVQTSLEREVAIKILAARNLLSAAARSLLSAGGP
jgi:serine/threonine protein kinase